jgi:OOP family OmpA-OmpF porin
LRKVALLIVGTAIGLGFIPPAAAQQCVAGPFMVFFDAKSDRLTPQAQAILDNAASAYATCGQVRVMIAGHTDRKGPAAASLALSRRTANRVRAYLVTRRIPVGLMTTQAFGESRPLVDTEDGVAEPQNRRVEITFGPSSGW